MLDNGIRVLTYDCPGQFVVHASLLFDVPLVAGTADRARAAGQQRTAREGGYRRPAEEAQEEEESEPAERRVEELREQVPPGMVEMLQISGLGVAKIRQIHEALDIDSLPELEAAAHDGRLARLPRFGQKTAENILKGIRFLRRASACRELMY